MTRPSDAERRRGMASLARLLAVVMAFVGVTLPCPAQEIVYSRKSVFHIPFDIEPSKPRPRQIQLYVSTDLGRTWLQAGQATAEHRGFAFTANRDGLYWFTVRIIESDGRANPATTDGMQPQVRVFVDTGPQVVFVRPAPARDGQVGVEWEIRDDNLDLRTLRLDYRTGGAWVAVPLNAPAATGMQYWYAPGGTVEARLSIHDRNGNPREAVTTLTPTGVGFGGGLGAAAPLDDRRMGYNEPPRTQPPANARVERVNTKRFTLNYKIVEKGPSGVSAVELWATTDRNARDWKLHAQDTSPNPQPPFVVDVVGEGVYGFTLVVKSGVGLGDKPPQVGDPPQVWVEVDLTKPVVSLEGVDVGRGANTGTLTIAWRASDNRGLADKPISLSFAEKAEGPWTLIKGDLDNQSRYAWTMPKDVPYKFFIRVEARDRAGNVGQADSTQPIVVDLSQPKGLILGVQPSEGR